MVDLIDCYKKKFDLRDSIFLPIEHDDAMVAIVYKVIPKSGNQMILKISTRSKDFYREHYFLKFFANKLAVPKVFNFIEPSEQIHGAILMEYLQGAPLNVADLTDQQAYHLGSVLAHIHCNRVARYGDLIDPDTLTTDPRVYFAAKFHEGIAECTGNLPDDVLEQCKRYFHANINQLLDVDGPCIIHRDFRPANIIVQNGQIRGIIDWASARSGFAQDDFCPIEHGEWPMSIDVRNSFFAGYASVRPVPHYEDVIKLLRLNRAIAILGFLHKQGTVEVKNARVYQYNRHYLETNF